MARPFEVSEGLQDILKKLAKKDKSLHEQVMKKIHEIVYSGDIEHYKNLKYNMKDSKRVHIGHFVLMFQYDKKKDSILLDDFDNHDKIYKR